MRTKIILTLFAIFLLSNNNMYAQSRDSTCILLGITFNNVNSNFSNIDKVFGTNNVTENPNISEGFSVSMKDKKRGWILSAELYYIGIFENKASTSYASRLSGYGYGVNFGKYLYSNKIFSIAPAIGFSSQSSSYKIFKTGNTVTDFNSSISQLTDEKQIDTYDNVYLNLGCRFGVDFSFLKCPMNFEIQPGYILQLYNPIWESNGTNLANPPKSNLGGFNLHFTLAFYLTKN